jgi:hypothetical protein
MKKTLFILFILAAFIGCEKEDDDTNKELTPGYTTITGHVVTSNNAPLKGVELQLSYVEKALLYSHSWLKKRSNNRCKWLLQYVFQYKR